MKRTVIFPFSVSDIPIVRLFNDLQNDYSLVGVVSLNGIGIEEEDISILVNQHPLGYPLHNIGWLKEAENEYDVVFIAPGSMMDSIHKYSALVIEDILSRGKEVVCFMRLSEQEKCKYQVYQNFIYLGEQSEWFVPPFPLHPQYQILNKLSTPVIYVSGLMSNVDNADVTLSLVAFGRKNGLVVKGVCGSPYRALIGLDVMPSFLYDTKYHEVEKIVLLNFYLHELEMKEHPDYIVVQLPDGMIPFSKTMHNDFGIYTYEWMMAHTPDYLVCCAPCSYTNPVFWSEFNVTIQQKYGCNLDGILISNKLINEEITDTVMEYRYEHLPLGQIERWIDAIREECEIPIYLTASIEDLESLFKQFREDILSTSFAEPIF